MKKSTETIGNLFGSKSRLILDGIIIGFFSGILIVLYRISIDKTFLFTQNIFKIFKNHEFFIPIWIIIFTAAGVLVGCMVKNNSMISGSGIPQLEGNLKGKLKGQWWKIILEKFIGGIICLAAGLSLGREGPSVQMGSAVGEGFSKVSQNSKKRKKYIITAGAGAGLAAAFNAPLAGTIFALEEINKNFSPKMFTCALTASITASFVSKDIFGLKPMFTSGKLNAMPLKSYGYLIILGAILGVMGVFFNQCLYKSQDIYASMKKVPLWVKTAIPFIVCSIMWFFMPQVLGGGEDLINSLFKSSLSIKFILLILIVKFIFTMISYGSSVPGGIFLPLLAVGALIGLIYGDFISANFGFSHIYINNLIVYAMAGYFASIVKSPITGIVLIVEMTGSLTTLMPMSLVCLVSYVVSDAFNSKPVYDELLKRILRSKAKSNAQIN